MKILKESILKLYPEYHTVYGPYIRKEDNRKIVSLYDGKRKSGRLLAKVILEVKIGRLLESYETVDHIDGNRENDDVDNLQVLSRIDNAKKDAIRVKEIYSKCIWCGTEFFISVSQRNSNKLHAGPFCSRSCCGKYARSIQLGMGKMERINFDKIYYTLNE